AIQIERRPAMLQDAVRLHDLLAGAQQALDQIGRVLDHVDVQPEDPRLVVQGPKEQVVTTHCQDSAALYLNRRRPARHARRGLITKVFLPNLDPPELGSNPARMTLEVA